MNPSLIRYTQVGSGIAEQEDHVYERNQLFFRTADRPVHDAAAPRDAQAETTDRRIRITNDAPVMRVDHASVKGMLLGVRQVPYRVSVTPILWK
jgi:hypothetical protein